MQTAFIEVADRVWVARHEWFDVNVSLIGSERGLLVVDTHASETAAGGVLTEVRRLGAGEVVGVINTHEHFDHTFGNAVFRDAFGPVPIHAHDVAAAATVPAGERIKALYKADETDPHRDEVLATRIVRADHTFTSAKVLDLGDRTVELVHPGRGHTAGDLVLRVPNVDLVLAGDLVEESAARSAIPGFGDDCFPLEWPQSLDVVLGLLTATSVVVPGHGAPVNREFVEDQRNTIDVVAQTIRGLADRGVPVTEALEAGEWPYPREELAAAVRRGYAHLPPGRRQLPLV